MERTITMSSTEQRRAWVLSRVSAGEMRVAEAAGLLDLSERSIHRLRARMGRDGPAGLVHGNRGRPSPSRSPEATRDRMPREGLLLQTDGSRHDWLEDRGPRLTLVGYIDDATGRVTGATFRDQEDTAG